MRGKKSQSQIVSTVLLILLVIVSVMVVIGFVVPFIKDKLSETGCIDVAGKITIQSDPSYTCYTEASNQMRVQIHNGDTEDLIKGFQISISDAGTGKSFEITSDNIDPEVTAYGGGSVEIPGKNEERTYVIDGIGNLPDSVAVYPILKDGGSCDASGSLSYITDCA